VRRGADLEDAAGVDQPRQPPTPGLTVGTPLRSARWSISWLDTRARDPPDTLLFGSCRFRGPAVTATVCRSPLTRGVDGGCHAVRVDRAGCLAVALERRPHDHTVRRVHSGPTVSAVTPLPTKTGVPGSTSWRASSTARRAVGRFAGGVTRDDQAVRETAPDEGGHDGDSCQFRDNV
jgi:hypothetical protein